MFEQFERHLYCKRFFNPEKKYLLAFSSGVDSVVLAHLLIKAGVNFSIAHCNFNLRGQDSEDDATFARTFAETKDIPFFYQSFDTQLYKKEQQVNTQLAARELRYTWFKKLLADEGFEQIITAHHASDNIETFLINALRGSGVKGFKGINEQTHEIRRPLLPFSKTQILEYAHQNYLNYRNDISNFDLRYERNYLRTKVVPLLKNLNPSFEQTLYTNTQHLVDVISIAEEYMQGRLNQIVHKENDVWKIDKKQLSNETHQSALLFTLLHPLGFNGHQLVQLTESLKQAHHSGKLFYSHTHRLLLDRDFIFVKSIEREDEEFRQTFLFNNIEEVTHFPHLKLKVEPSTELVFDSPAQLLVDVSSLVFPLCIRQKKQGDKFKPFGMKQFKKLSDFFINAKLSEFEKEKVWILENGNEEIIWVIGYRSDERYRVRGNETHLYKFQIDEGR